MAEHDLKTWPEPFAAVASGRKRFEYRKDDRGFDVGDVLVLRCWSPHTSSYSGSWARMTVTFIARGPDFGIPRGYCVMSIKPEGSVDG